MAGSKQTKHIFAGSQRITLKMVNGTVGAYEGEQYYFHPDHLGSSSFITDTAGDVYEHLEYFPYGETWGHQQSGSTTTPYKFTGKELDEETGLYYYGARYYDPRTSVWVSADPILNQYMNGRGNQGIFNSKNLMMFSYTMNNPVTLIDPDGKMSESAARAEAASYGEGMMTPVHMNAGANGWQPVPTSVAGQIKAFGDAAPQWVRPNSKTSENVVKGALIVGEAAVTLATLWKSVGEEAVDGVKSLVDKYVANQKQLREKFEKNTDKTVAKKVDLSETSEHVGDRQQSLDNDLNWINSDPRMPENTSIDSNNPSRAGTLLNGLRKGISDPVDAIRKVGKTLEDLN